MTRSVFIALLLFSSIAGHAAEVTYDGGGFELFMDRVIGCERDANDNCIAGLIRHKVDASIAGETTTQVCYQLAEGRKARLIYCGTTPKSSLSDAVFLGEEDASGRTVMRCVRRCGPKTPKILREKVHKD